METIDYKKVAYWVLLGWEVWILKVAWTLTKFIGRVLLWIACWPLGLWRSITRHGDKRNDKLVRAMNRAA